MNKKNERSIDKCGGKRGCTLDEYLIPKCTYDKFIFFCNDKVYRNDISVRYDIPKILSVSEFNVDKVKKKEKVKDVA